MVYRSGERRALMGSTSRTAKPSAVTRPQSPELRTLAGKIQDIEPHTADALNGWRRRLFLARGLAQDCRRDSQCKNFHQRPPAIVNGTAPTGRAFQPPKPPQPPGMPKPPRPPSLSASIQSVPEHVEQVRNGPEGTRRGESKRESIKARRQRPQGLAIALPQCRAR